MAKLPARPRCCQFTRTGAIYASPRLNALALTMILSAGAPCLGLAQTAAGNAGTPPSNASAPPDYHPSFGDLMTMAVQPRHIKLGLAGQRRNWAYVAYELSELRGAFARIAHTIPTYRSVDTAEMITATMKAPLDALDRAIMAADAKRFADAYARLTRACNACHQSQNHAAVVIRVPDAAMYSDQDFRPMSR